MHIPAGMPLRKEKLGIYNVYVAYVTYLLIWVNIRPADKLNLKLWSLGCLNGNCAVSETVNNARKI